QAAEQLRQLVGVLAGPDPAVAEPGGATQRCVARAADPDRRRRRRGGAHLECAEVEEAPAVLDHRAGPRLAQHLDRLVVAAAARREVDAERVVLLADPARAGAERDASAREQRSGPDLLRDL